MKWKIINEFGKEIIPGMENKYKQIRISNLLKFNLDELNSISTYKN